MLKSRKDNYPYMDYSLFPEKDPLRRTRMSSTGEEVPRDASVNEKEAARRARVKSESAAAAAASGSKSPTKPSFFDYSMFPDRMDTVPRK